MKFDSAEFQAWLKSQDPETPTTYAGPERRQTLQRALTDAMDLEFEQLKNNERWATHQANLWRAEYEHTVAVKDQRDRQIKRQRKQMLYMICAGIVLLAWNIAVSFALYRMVKW